MTANELESKLETQTSTQLNQTQLELAQKKAAFEKRIADRGPIPDPFGNIPETGTGSGEVHKGKGPQLPPR